MSMSNTHAFYRGLVDNCMISDVQFIDCLTTGKNPWQYCHLWLEEHYVEAGFILRTQLTPVMTENTPLALYDNSYDALDSD